LLTGDIDAPSISALESAKSVRCVPSVGGYEMRFVDSVKLSASFLRARVTHLHGLATAGAMLVCLAIVLNVGLTTKTPKPQSPDDSLRRASPITEQPVALTSALQVEIGEPMRADHSPSPNQAADVNDPAGPSMEAAPNVEVVPQPTMASAEIVEPIRPSIEAAPAADGAPSAPQHAMAKDAEGGVQSDPSQQVFTTVPATALPGDPVNPDPLRKATIVGFWAPDAGTCSARDFREGILPAVINAEGAWAGDTFCVFKNKKQTETGWNVVAKCSNPREQWTANVRLTVHDNRLTWTSKRGTQVYTRCAPDVLMADVR
jgi:hypothetical protein